jgi:hypothetical protein
MTENNGHTGFEKGLQESFGDFMQTPDPAVWAGIEAGLQRRRRIVLFARLAAAASLLLLFSITGWLVFRTSDPAYMHPPIVSHQTEPGVSEKEALEVPETILTEADQIIEPVPERKKELAQTIEPAKAQPVLPQVREAEPVLADISEPEPTPEIPLADYTGDLTILDPTEIAIQTEPVIAEQKLPTLEEVERLLATDEFIPEKPEEKKWQLALGYGTLQGQGITDPSQTYENADANFSQDPFSSKFSNETSRFSSVENTSHSQPITLGFMVNRNFSGSWGIETGLLLTRLKTLSNTNIVNDEYSVYGSELIYLGIPVSIRLNMIQGRRFGMYISQGAVLEKGVRTRYYSNLYAFDALKSTEEETYVAEGVQISSLTAVGFEFRLSDLISIYAQPGLQVFFLNQTQPYNIRSSSAIWPSLQTGLKFQL